LIARDALLGLLAALPAPVIRMILFSIMGCLMDVCRRARDLMFERGVSK
jgi:hypothetical protein